MNRPLVGTGILLVLIGLVALGIVALSRPSPYNNPSGNDGSGKPSAPLVGESQGALNPRSRALPVIGGLAVAAGAACIGIGMNRWGASRAQPL